MFFGWAMAGPKLTPEQAERAEHVAEEKAEARADEAAYRERVAAVDWQQFEERRRQVLAQIARDDAERQRQSRERDDDGGREREQ